MGNLINEAAFWLGWMQSLRHHIIRVRQQATIPKDKISLEKWRTWCAVNILVSLSSFCSRSGFSALTTICTALEPCQPIGTGQGGG